MSRYFRMLGDVDVPGRWHLVEPVDRAGSDVESLLWGGKRLQLDGPLRVQHSKFAKRGRPVDYCELDGAQVPVVHARVAEVLSELAGDDVQLLPVGIEGHPEQFFVVNVVRVSNCIDDEACTEAKHYTEADPEVFADQRGEYKRVIGLRIDPSKVDDARIFRTWGWVAIIVSEEVKTALERIGTVGVSFIEV